MKAFETTIAESADSLAGPWRRPHQMLHAQTYDSHASIHDDATVFLSIRVLTLATIELIGRPLR